MKHALRTALAACSMAVASLDLPLAAAAEPPACPATAKPPETAAAPDGWRAWRSDEARDYPLAAVSFSDGPPEERVFLAPTSSRTRGRERVDAYDLTAPSIREVWLICQYRDTPLSLVRSVDLRGKRCEVATQTGKAATGHVSMVCR